METKKIAVNVRLLLPGKLDGIGWFTYQTLKRITRNNPDTEFLFLFDRPWSDEFIFSNNITPVALFPQARHPILYNIWFEWSVPYILKKHGADLFFSPDGFLSLKTHVPQHAVIHDLNFEHYPDDLPFLTGNYYRHFFPKYARKAVRLATVSAFSRNDIAERYGVSSDKIDVVYNGVHEDFKVADAKNIDETRRKFTGGMPYFLFVGMLHKRKNIANLFRAFDAFRKQNDTNVKLLIVGHRKWWTDEMEKALQEMQYKNEVIFTGRIPMDELTAITAAALATTYVSYFEGFGVPVLESMKSGVPVITSDITAIPEVAGDAALLTNPFDVTSISRAMTTVYRDESLRKSMINKGLVQCRRFSWNQTADLLWSSLERTLDENRKKR